MILARGGKAQRRTGRRNGCVIAFLRQMDIAARDDKARTLVSEQQHLHGEQAAVDLAAFCPRDTAAFQAAEAGDAVSFAVQPDFGLPETDLGIPVERAEYGASVAVRVAVDRAAGEDSFRRTVHRSQCGKQLTGRGKTDAALFRADFCRTGMAADQQHLVSVTVNLQLGIPEGDVRRADIGTDADHADTVSDNIQLAAAYPDALAGTPAAAQAQDLFAGGTNGDRSLLFQADRSVGIVIL